MRPFARYESYRDSGIEWLGEIPAHWELRRLRYSCDLNPSKSELNGLPMETEVSFLPMESIGEDGSLALGRTKPLEDVYQGYTYMRDGDVVVAKITPCFENGKSAVCRDFQNGIAFGTTELHVLRPRPNSNAKYLFYLIHSQPFRTLGQAMMLGSAGQKRVPEDYVQNFTIGFPPLSEQSRIAIFLDEKTADIEDAIAKKQRLIALLQEQKAILINNAVTKGLNPDVPMRESGVEWICRVPAHWEVKRAKYIFHEIDERSEAGEEELLSVSHMTGVTPRSEKNVSMFMAEDYAGSKLCRKDDLVFNIMWAWMGALGVSDRTGIVSSSYGVYRQRKEETFNSWYLEHLMRSNEYVAEYNRRSTGLHSSRLRLYPHMFLDMEISIPGKEEQDQIAAVTNERTYLIDETINAVKKEIERLDEFRAILISNAVTGKIKI